MQEISIGTLARRTGVAVSALRYYETLGILSPERSAGGQRRYPRSDIRKVSFLLAAQKFGFTLPRIQELLATLPHGRAPTARDWAAMSQLFHTELTAQIDALMRLRDKLDGCIGCGCLSLDNCALHNPDDAAGAQGPGARFLIGDQYTSTGR